MKVVAFNGSPREGGNTEILLKTVLKELEAEGIQTELVSFGGNLVHGCTACMQCFKRQDQRCAIDGDGVNAAIRLMVEAEGILMGSPTYFSDLTPELKALIDRSGFVNKANGDMLARKVGAAVVAVRRAGAVHVFDSINHFFGIAQMITVGSVYWNLGIGSGKGEVEKDAEGIKTMEVLGRNMAWVLHRLHG